MRMARKRKRYYVTDWAPSDRWYIVDGDKGTGICYSLTRADARRIANLLNESDGDG